MTKFAYNNIKNVSSNHTLFKSNYSYLSYVLYKKDVNLQLNLKSITKLAKKLINLINIYRKTLHYIQKL